MNYLTLFFTSIGLSVDAFSLSLAYGLLKISNKKIIITSMTVGIYHFIMPIIGFLVAGPFLRIIKFDSKYIISFVFLLLIISILKSFKEKENVFPLSYKEIIIFGLFVSIDSFSVGIGLKFLNTNILVASLFFSITSFILTFFGMKLGKYINRKIGDISKIIGIIILLILTFSFLLT